MSNLQLSETLYVTARLVMAGKTIPEIVECRGSSDAAVRKSLFLLRQKLDCTAEGLRETLLAFGDVQVSATSKHGRKGAGRRRSERDIALIKEGMERRLEAMELRPWLPPAAWPDLSRQVVRTELDR